jgi:iron(III) transport system substrate-binding protein
MDGIADCGLRIADWRKFASGKVVRSRVFHFTFLIFNCLIAGCGNSSNGTASPSKSAPSAIVIYSPHGAELEGDVKKRFEAAHPEYTVQFLDLGGGEILAKLKAEQQQPRADVWWGGSPVDFNRAEAAGLLDPYAPEWTRNLPEDAKSPAGAWVATFRTPEVIMYNANVLKREEVPDTWDGLLDPKWKGKIVIRDVRASATMKTIFGSLILRAENVDAGFEFLRKLDANTGAYAANPQVLYDYMKSGRCPVTLWNMADALLQKSFGYPFEYVIPRDAIVPVEPIALIKGGPNPTGAKLFHDFVNTPAQLILMARERNRLPARTDISVDQLPEWMRNLKLEPMKIDWSVLDKNLEKWIARWDSEIKGKGGQH